MNRSEAEPDKVNFSENKFSEWTHRLPEISAR